MTETYSPKNLLAGGSMPIVSGAVTLLEGQDLEAGSVLGMVTKDLGDSAFVGDGDGVLSGVAMGAAVQIGSYRIVCITAPSEAGEDDAVFAVFAPDGTRLEDAEQGKAYSNSHLVFTIGAADQADFAAGDVFTVPVEAGSGGYKLVNSSNVDGSANPCAILAADVDATSEDTVAPVHFSGEFNEDALTFGGTDDADTHREALRALGIFLKTVAA